MDTQQQTVQVTHQRTLQSVESLTRELMTHHGLIGWNFKWLHSYRCYGRCYYNRKLIGLSKRFVLSSKVTDSDIRNVILHEIAHALEPGAHHGPRWVARALAIGCDGKRCSPVQIERKVRYVYQCTRCEYILERMRQINYIRLQNCTHYKCGGFFKPVSDPSTLQSLKQMYKEEGTNYIDLQVSR